ncbi:MAG: MATE family efflux transporter [Planctomycetota bacterium]
MTDGRIPEEIEVPAPDPMPVPSPVIEAPLTPNGWRELGEVLWLSFPIIVTMFSYTLMSAIDVVMVGHHSAAELAAVGPAASAFFLIASLMMGTLSITNTFVAQSVGRGEKHAAPRYVWQAVHLTAIWGAIAWSLSPLAPKLFAWAGHETHIQIYEVSYFEYMLLRIPALGFWMALSGFYQATKRPVIPMIVGLVGNVFNLALNYALIFGEWGFPEMGITGAAVATVVATYFQAALMFVMFLGPRTHGEYGSRNDIGVELVKLWRMIRVGLPSGLSWSLENACWTLFLLKVVGSLGAAALAANNATMQIIHLSFMPVIGLNIGVQAIVGQHIGMGDHAGATRRVHRAMGLAFAFMVTMGLMFVVFRRGLIGLFCPGEAAAGIVAMGSTMLIFAAIFQAFDSVAIICYGALKGAGDTVFPMCTSVACGWFVFLPLAYGLTHTLKLGVAGAWLGVTVYVALLAGINFWRFSSGAWRKIDLFKGEA